MTDSKTFVVGVVSSPHPHAPMHIMTLDTLQEVKDIHLCGIEGEDLEAMKSQSHKVRSYSTELNDLLKLSDLDALLVSVRNDLCTGVLSAAVEAGIPVLFEKPGATQASNLREISDKAKSKKITMGAMYTNRWSPQIKDVRRIIKGAWLGKIMAVESRMVTSQIRYRDPRHWLFSQKYAGSGILSWLACHHIDALCYLLNEHIVEVSAMVANNNPEKVSVEDTAMVAFKFESGVLGTMHAGYHLAGSMAGYTGGAYDTFIGIRGVDGYVRIPRADDDGFTVYSEVDGWEPDGIFKTRYPNTSSPAYGGKAGEKFVLDFLKASRTGRPAPAPIDDAVHVMDVIEAILKSSTTGNAVQVGQ